ncbi:MAG TPA: PhaM family polyhydroxyalkanoate granule multifunctional regulatory protein [Burkholderiaceae bacterium]
MAASGAALTKLVPGFEFLQGLVKNAGAAMPNVGQWIAPTLDPAELDKRIEELRTVQFWLEQNARMLATTIQALEVQRMTLSTLKTMNVTVSDLGQAMKLRLPDGAGDGAADASAVAARGEKRGAAPVAAGVVDPMQWWGALTQQFTQLAVQAMREGTTDAAKQFAGTVAKQSLDAAGKTLKKAAKVPAAVARSARDAVQSAAKPPPRRAAKRAAR